MINALLLSNSTMPGTPFFTWPKPFVKTFLEGRGRRALFIPFAAVTFSFDEYEQKLAEALAPIGIGIQSIHRHQHMITAIREAELIMVGGGNTFALLARMYKYGLLNEVRAKVQEGTPYIGWSAGANLACPTIMTTNDMPVIQPPSFEALNLVPFQINPHYHELKFEGQGGETRKERLEEFVAMNLTRKVIGLPEGMLIERKGDQYELKGTGIAKLYQHAEPMAELTTGPLMMTIA